jgi:hypothetical protein
MNSEQGINISIFYCGGGARFNVYKQILSPRDNLHVSNCAIMS